MMYFDFFNYTFSAVISFVTAIFGMSYPLLIESIQKIDDRYHSRHLKNRFEESFVFVLFDNYLIFSIIVSVVMPFLLAAAESQIHIRYILISIQIVMLIMLALITIWLVRQIQLYNDPERLMSYILQVATKRDYNIVIDIMKHVSKTEDPEIYKKGMQWISDWITEENMAYGKI